MGVFKMGIVFKSKLFKPTQLVWLSDSGIVCHGHFLHWHFCHHPVDGLSIGFNSAQHKMDSDQRYEVRFVA